ncbi:hypothetical protein K2173_005605 [Erythroxylum novogranatense]|uniref:Cardiolipin synthase n=1 Tax=Erythroxylum novogranatense TaxID=1862640 RepID=A0AAV8T737_9ROSI|nr:hypothetical protein K2173_005605 [Erythroxylum novogranatense]
MAIFRSLRTVITRNKESSKKVRTFFTVTSISIIPSPCAPICLQPVHYSPYHRSFSPLPKWIAPFHGPLFLSSPPWKLSQSATPLHLRGDSLVLKKVEAFHLNLLKSPVGSGFAARVVFDRVDDVEEDGFGNPMVESFVNLPNLISFSRMLSGPFLGWMITSEMYTAAFLGLAISGATDWLDGYVARKMKIDSVVGSYLDPLADKVLIGSVALAMVQKDLLHPGLVGLVVCRDIGLVGGALYHRARSLGWKWDSWYDFLNLDGTRPEKVEPLFISKINTVLQLVLVAAALVQPDFGTEETKPYITYLSWLVVSTTMASGAAYGTQHMRNKYAWKC